MWEISLSLQIEAFLWSLFFGAVFCIAFDLLCLIDTELSFGKITVAVLDILFFALLGFFDFCFFLVFCNGEIRGYVFVGEIIGFFLCKKLLKFFYMAVFYLFFKAAKIFFRAIKQYVLEPPMKILEKISQKCFKIGQKAVFFIKKCLKNPKRLVYTKEKCPKEQKG